VYPEACVTASVVVPAAFAVNGTVPVSFPPVIEAVAGTVPAAGFELERDTVSVWFPASG
jgi:hypothetical protein